MQNALAPICVTVWTDDHGNKAYSSFLSLGLLYEHWVKASCERNGSEHPSFVRMQSIAVSNFR